jgi:glucose uptake protein GlcU
MAPGLMGLLYASAAVLLFTAFPLPTKNFATADGIYFQALMAAGIWLVGAVLFWVQCATSSGCPTFAPFSCLGGAIWALSNLFLCPIVDTIGVGLCMLFWGCSEMLSGWATARFGLFGVAAQPVSNPALNYAGVGLGVLSLLVLSVATPAVADGSDRAPAGDEEALLPASLLPASPGLQEEGGALAKAGADAGWAFWKRWAPQTKRFFGVAASLVAGSLSGSTFTPVQHVVDHPELFPGAPRTLLGNLHAHFTGILFTALSGLLAYAAATGNRPWVSSPLTLPALCAGVCWGVAMIFWFLANDALSIVIAFPIVTLGPGVLSMVVGLVFFREMTGARNMVLLAAALALFLGSAVSISASGGNG